MQTVMQPRAVQRTTVQTAPAESALSELGQNILILVETCDDCIHELRTLISRIPNIDQRSFTLLHCCPPIFWEHGGSDHEAQRQCRQIWEAEETAFSETQQYFAQVRLMLRKHGVIAENISMRLALQSSLMDATIRELRQGDYTGIILCGNHRDIVNRLSSRNPLTRFIKQTPVAVCTFDMATTA